jgi:hypothetical protein
MFVGYGNSAGNALYSAWAGSLEGPVARCWPAARGQGPPERIGSCRRCRGVRKYLRVAASYWSATLAGMRPRSLTGRPVALAQARMPALR